MRISFFSNYLNEHQLPFCQALNSRDDTDFCFIALDGRGTNAGRNNLNDEYQFVLREYVDSVHSVDAMRHAEHDDLVLFGHMGGKEQYVKARMSQNLLSFRSTERILKRGLFWRFVPPKAMRTYRWFTRYKNKPMYILCESAFASFDLSLSGWPKEKCYKWGYFPEVESHRNRVHSLVEGASILWAARFVELKRPYAPLHLAKQLKKAGYAFRLNMVGDGPMRTELEAYVDANGLRDVVWFSGMLSGDDTKRAMCKSDIFLATSSRKEGWGATVNEAMAAGCAVVASASMGSAPFLIDDGINGFLYDDLDQNGLLPPVLSLLGNEEFLNSVSKKAQATVSTEWSAICASERLISLYKALADGKNVGFKSGPCSAAPIIKDDWYHRSNADVSAGSE